MDETHERASEEPPRKRRRAKVACRPCRDRKRKCDGQEPCKTCVRFEYDCHYEASPKTRVSAAGTAYSHDNVLRSDPPQVYEVSEPIRSNQTTKPSREPWQSERTALPGTAQAHLQSLEANSAAAFVRKLGLRIDPNNAPRLRLFGWNTGERLLGCPPGRTRLVTSMLSYTSMRDLAQTYFAKCAVVYGCIDERSFYERLGVRWSTVSEPNPYDQVILGVAALGFHFSQPNPSLIEPDVVESARVLLEQYSLVSPPSIDTVTAWVLRVAYLRLTSTPHITWMASCSLMHVIEAARVHQEVPPDTIFDETQEAIAVGIRRRIWGTAQHLNIWASFDLGRTRITLPNATTKPLMSQIGDHTSELLGLVPLTEILDPNQARSTEELESDLTQVLDRQFEEPPVVMGQTNLALCIFRRLRAQKPAMAYSLTDKLLDLARKALDAARAFIASYCPWHHAANIPFQIVCMLLAVDSRASLAMVSEALAVVKNVRDTWNSIVMQETYDTAYLLILLHQRRKEEDAIELRSALNTQTPLGENAMNGEPRRAPNRTQSGHPDSAESIWLDDLFTNVPGLKEFDLEQFLIQDTLNPQDLNTFGGLYQS